MAPAVERRDRIRRSDSPVGDRRSPRRRSSPRRERSPAHHRSSPRMRSPHKSSSSYRARSPVKERLPDRTGSPKQAQHRLSSRASPSRSPSPRTKRLRHAQLDRGADKLAEKEHVNSASREDRDKGRHREHEEGRDAQSDKRPPRDRNDGGSSRSSRRERSMSPEEHGHRSRYSSRSRSPPRPSKAGGRDGVTKSSATAEHMNGDNDSVAKMKAAEEALEGKEKQKPSFELSGKLADETNRVRGITLLFTEPADARKPDVRWRLYVFKAGEVLNEPLYVHRQTCYLFGRERRVADIPTDHPSCSKQHAVLQYRLVEKERPDGLMSKQVRPYMMDLGSTNGTFINDNRIEPQRYYELFEKDTIKFGNSSREYVLLHENSNSNG